MAAKPKQDIALLKRIRATRDYYVREWSDIHKEGSKDVKYVAGNPWDSSAIASRETDEQERPHLSFDEASQYINGFLGKARQQKRSVKVEVGDNLADKDTATQLQGRIYSIEHKSKAQSKYIGALRDAATRGYGFFGFGKRYSDPKSMVQEPFVRGFDNPDCVLMDPDCKEYDASDATGCFVDDKMQKAEFQRKFRKFKPKDLDPEVDTLIVTEFWDVQTDVVDRVLVIDDGKSEKGIEVVESELPGGKYTGDEKLILDERDVEEKTVVMYLCQMTENAPDEEKHSDFGVEILEVTEWDDDSIPIVPVYGESFFVTEGTSSPKRVRLSLIRRARDPMDLLNFSMSAAAERVAMMPKTRWMMASGQQIGHEEDYRTVGTSGLGFLLYEPTTDAATGVTLPPPEPVTWQPQLEPALQLIRVCQDSIRSAVGQIASPELQKNDSGVAIKRLNDTGDNASFHLIDNFAQSIERGGCILGRLVRKTHDTDRHVSVRSDLDQEKIVRINAPHPDENGKVIHYDFTKGEYSYTISTGPSHDSQADAIRDWATTLATTDPKVGGQILDLLTEMQNFGPEAKPLIDRLKKLIGPAAAEDGQQPNPEALKAELSKGQQMIDLLTKALQEAQHKIETEEIKAAKDLKIQEMKDANNIKVEEIKQADKVPLAQLDALVRSILLDAQHAHEAAQSANQAQSDAASQQAQQEHQAGMQDSQLSSTENESALARQQAADLAAQEPATQ